MGINEKTPDSKYHYVLIRNLTTLLKAAMTRSHNKIHICRFCLNCCYTWKSFEAHNIICREFKAIPSVYPRDQRPRDVLQFERYSSHMPLEIFAVGDFETYNASLDDENDE